MDEPPPDVVPAGKFAYVGITVSVRCSVDKVFIVGALLSRTDFALITEVM